MSKRLYGFPALVALLILWQLLAAPSPWQVAVTLGHMLVAGPLLVALVTTILRMLAGFCLAAIPGLLLGLTTSRGGLPAALIGSAVKWLQVLPAICWLPLVCLWLGPHEAALVLTCGLGGLFAVTAATNWAIRAVPVTYARAATTMGASNWQAFSRVMLPAALPALISGLRLGWSYVWRTLLAAELVCRIGGLGPLLNSDAAQTIAVLLVLLIVGVVVDRWLFGRAEGRLRRQWGIEAE